MYLKEKRPVKWALCLFFSVSAIVYFICGVLSAERSINARKINADYASVYRDYYG